MLRSMLDAHPDIAIPSETRFLLGTYRRRQDYGDLRDPENRRRVADFIVRREDSRFAYTEMDEDWAWARLAAAPPTIGSINGTLFQLYAETHGKMRWGDKRPMYVLHLATIMDMFPDAQFINMVRDPRAVAASIKKLGWWEGDIARAVVLWLASIAAHEAAAGYYRPDQYISVRYEDLVQEPGQELLLLSRFLRLDVDHIDEMLAIQHGAQKSILTKADPEAPRFHPNVVQPVMTSRIDAWRSVLTDDEVALVEAKAGSVMERYGYVPSLSSPAAPEGLLEAYAEGVQEREEEDRETTQRVLIAQEEAVNPAAARLTAGQRYLAAVGATSKEGFRIDGDPVVHPGFG